MTPTHAPRILIAEPDPTLAAHLSRILMDQGYDPLLASTGREAFKMAVQFAPDSAIVDESLPDMDGTELCKQLRQHAVTFSLPVLILTRTSDAASKIAVIEAGANDHLTRPFHPDALIYRIKSILVRSQTGYGGLVGGTRYGRIIAFFGSKGGVGTTSLATNLAIALHQKGAGKVLLFDTAFSFGDIGVHLDINTNKNVLDLVKNVDELDPTAVEQVLVRHSSGIRVLLGPAYPEESETIQASHMEQLLKYLAELYNYLIIDCPTNYDDRTLTVLEHADEIMVVMTPEIGAIKNTSMFIRLAQRLKLPLQNVHIVLNRANSNSQIGLKEIERILQQDIQYRIVSSGHSMVQSVTRGVPIVLQRGQHPFAEQVYAMADTLLGHTSSPAVAPAPFRPQLLEKLASRQEQELGASAAFAASMNGQPQAVENGARPSLWRSLWNRMTNSSPPTP